MPAWRGPVSPPLSVPGNAPRTSTPGFLLPSTPRSWHRMPVVPPLACSEHRATVLSGPRALCLLPASSIRPSLREDPCMGPSLPRATARKSRSAAPCPAPPKRGYRAPSAAAFEFPGACRFAWRGLRLPARVCPLWSAVFLAPSPWRLPWATSPKHFTHHRFRPSRAPSARVTSSLLVMIALHTANQFQYFPVDDPNMHVMQASQASSVVCRNGLLFAIIR